MEFDLHPSVTLRTGTFAALVAPEDLVLAGLNDNPVLRRFLFLFVSGNYSRLLSGINRRSVTIEIRRAFTAFQLLTILRESYHTILFVEHDPGLYEGAGKEVVPQVAQALKGAGQNAAVVLYAPCPRPHLLPSWPIGRPVLLALAAASFRRRSGPPGGPVRHPSGPPAGPDHAGGVLMGRSFAERSNGGKEITGRWERAARALPGADGEAALRVVAMARRHASEGFYAFDDPLEAGRLLGLHRDPESPGGGACGY